MKNEHSMKKKIMFMTNNLYGGGAEKVLQSLLNNLNYDKYDVTLYSLHRSNLDDNYSNNIKYKVVFDDCASNNVVTKMLFSIFSKIRGKIFICCPPMVFYRLFINEKYDVEIAFIEGESTKIISGSTNKKSKKIAWVHVDLLANPWTDFLYKDVREEQKNYLKFDKIVCVSQGVKDAFIKKYNIKDRI